MTHFPPRLPPDERRAPFVTLLGIFAVAAVVAAVIHFVWALL
jgi:hypothetical protein